MRKIVMSTFVQRAQKLLYNLLHDNLFLSLSLSLLFHFISTRLQSKWPYKWSAIIVFIWSQLYLVFFYHDVHSFKHSGGVIIINTSESVLMYVKKKKGNTLTLSRFTLILCNFFLLFDSILWAKWLYQLLRSMKEKKTTILTMNILTVKNIFPK